MKKTSSVHAGFVWLSNIHKDEVNDPKNADWISGKLISLPQATSQMTREELESAGMRGIYAPKIKSESK